MVINGQVFAFFEHIKTRSVFTCLVCERKIADARVPAGGDCLRSLKDLELYCKHCEKYSLFKVEEARLYDAG